MMEKGTVKFESSKKFASSREKKVRKFKKAQSLSSNQILISNPGICALAVVGAAAAMGAVRSQLAAAADPDADEFERRRLMEALHALGGEAAARLREREPECVGACSREAAKLTEAELSEHLQALPLWTKAGDGLERRFVAKHFAAAVNFLTDVAELAENLGHHPDLHVESYRCVRVTVYTHAIGGISIADAILCAHIDAVPVDYSPKWLKEACRARGLEATAAAGGFHADLETIRPLYPAFR